MLCSKVVTYFSSNYVYYCGASKMKVEVIIKTPEAAEPIIGVSYYKTIFAHNKTAGSHAVGCEWRGRRAI